MAGEWMETTLGEVVEDGGGLIQTGPFGSQLHASDYKTEGIPVIMPVNISSDRVDVTDIARISREDAGRLSKHLVEPGDIVYSRRGDVTRKALITEDETGMFCGTGCLLVRPGKEIDPKFLKYHLSSPTNQAWIIRHAVGATMPNLNTGILGDVPLRVPSPEMQKSIAHILGTLDDKIELNRRMNVTLESMARALFKSWFVDFDPVIDNALAAGNPIPEPLSARAQTRRDLGTKRKPLPKNIQKLFPSSFVFDDAMGWMPEGWEVSSIGEEVDSVGGGTPSTKNCDYWEDGEHSFCTPKDMSRLDSMVLLDTERHLTDAGVEKINSGVLPVRTLLMSSRAPIGYLAVSEIPVSINQGIIAMLPSDTYGPVYLRCWVEFNMGRIEDRANGSTFQEISKKNFRPIPKMVPSPSLLAVFNDQSEAIYLRCVRACKDISTLTKLRDTLLPKLLSGELCIPEAEKLVASSL